MIQREPLLTWEPSSKKGFKKNYFVPNFGSMDTDLADSYKSLATTEDKLSHKLGWTKADDGNKKNYFIPQFGMDVDVATSLNNLKEQEADKGAWVLPKDDWFWAKSEIKPQKATIFPLINTNLKLEY